MAISPPFCREVGKMGIKKQTQGGKARRPQTRHTLRPSHRRAEESAAAKPSKRRLIMMPEEHLIELNCRIDGVFHNIRMFLQEQSKTPPWRLHFWFNIPIGHQQT